MESASAGRRRPDGLGEARAEGARARARTQATIASVRGADAPRPRTLPDLPWAVVLDLDETLIVEASAVDDALQATAGGLPAALGVDPRALAATVRAEARARWQGYAGWPWAHQVGISSWEALVGRFEGPGPELAGLRTFAPGYRTAVWTAALAAHGVADRTLAEALVARFPDELAPRRAPYPETERVLSALRPRARLGLLTNGAPDLQREKARAAGLLPWFDAVVVSGDLGVGKPDPRVFRHVLERLGVPPERAIMVGDNPERDVAGGRASGLATVWVERTGAAAPPAAACDLRVRTLDEALPWILTRTGGGAPGAGAGSRPGA